MSKIIKTPIDSDQLQLQNDAVVAIWRILSKLEIAMQKRVQSAVQHLIRDNEEAIMGDNDY